MELHEKTECDMDSSSSEDSSQNVTSHDIEDVTYICTIAKTSIPVSVIRLAPPAKSNTERSSVIKLNSDTDNAQNFEKLVLNSEFLNHTNDNELGIQCNLCGKQFTQQRNFNYHMAQHNGSQLFACTCPICGKSYRNKGYLSNHLKIHKNAKEYRCEWCSKSFNQRVAYNTHIRVHTGYTPHKCLLCDKAFSRKTVLTSHIRSHTGEKPFKCSTCGKSFVDKSNMLTHQRLHTGEKPFRCHICGKSFTQRNHLKTHINYHVGIKPYHCNKCNARFSQSSNLKMHSQKCTGILRAGNGNEHGHSGTTSFAKTTPLESSSERLLEGHAKSSLPIVQWTDRNLQTSRLQNPKNSQWSLNSLLAQRLLSK